MTSSPPPIVQPAYLFRYSAFCPRRRTIWGKNGVRLEPRFRLPCFTEIEGQPLFADVRAAWNSTGLSFNLTVGNRADPLRRNTTHEPEDALYVWISTRDTVATHRPNQFCHHFVFYRFGTQLTSTKPVALWTKLSRATAHPRPVTADALRVRTEPRANGYRLEAHIAAAALTGFDPQDHPALGFSYTVADCEHGWQAFSKRLGQRIGHDPSLWETLELVDD